MNKAIFALAMFAAAGTAGAQTMYRCGSSYSQQPCAGGSEVAGLAPRPASDVAQAKAAAQADAKRAEAMEKARLAQEKNAPRAMVMGPKEAASAPPRAEAKKKHPGHKPEEFTAVQPGTVKAKKKS
jgi:hypothetical protein